MKNIMMATAALCLLTLPAMASTVCFTNCTAGTEQMIFFDRNASGTSDVGNIAHTGAPFDFNAGSVLDFFADGFGTIKPSGGAASFGSLTVFDPGHTFTDLAWSAQLADPPPPLSSFTVDVYGLGHVLLGENTYTNMVNQNQMYLLTSTLPITSVLFTSAGGFEEMKQFEVSGAALAPVPLPAAGFLFGPTLVGLWWATRRKESK